MEKSFEKPIVFLLPYSHYQDALNELKLARDSSRSLYTSCELLIEKLKGQAEPVDADALKPGKSYGYFGVSPLATASRNGQMIPYHGEIYLYRAVYQPVFGPDTCVLVSETGLGAVSTKHLLPGMLLVEV